MNTIDQGINFQMSSLRHCSARYSQETEWLLEADVDEFYVPTRAFTGHPRNEHLSIYDCPVKPLVELLKNWLYAEADAIAVSRVTFKNQGIYKLDNDSSV
jgi:hypothetical protein